jgi:catechol 2,3-dioxygenase-like lactoylglutathione lyase family enzyme
MTSKMFLAAALSGALAISLCAARRPDRTSASQTSQTSSSTPTLAITCLITKDVRGLSDFYQQVLQIEPHRTGDDYVEFRTSSAALALYSAAAQENYIPGAAVPAANRSSILQFRVADVDREYARLQPIVKVWVKPPTTQPWGTRSIYFRDPDGNLVDFFAPAAAR